MNRTIAKLLVSCTLLASSIGLTSNVSANTQLQPNQVRFIATDGGSLVQDNNLREELIKNFDANTLLKDILPEVRADDSYKFRGWYSYTSNKGTEKVTITDTLKVANNDYRASFYKDINNNNIDDTTEKITLKFVSNNDEQINDAKLHVGQSFTFPTLSEKEGYVLAGWYIDKDLKTKYNEKNPLIKDTTLYAKWEKKETSLDDALTNSIVSKIKELFESRFNLLEEDMKETKAKVDSLSSQQIVINPTQTVEQAPIVTTESEETAQPASTEQTQSTQSTSQPTTVNPSTQTVTTAQETAQPSTTIQSQPSEQTQTINQQEVLTYTEPTYVYNNANVGQKFVVKFYNENDKLLYMLELPYGHTIRTLNQDDKLIKEFAVRQNTKITMATKDYMSDVAKEMLEIESRVITENSSQITEVFPTEVIVVEESVLNDINNKAQQEGPNKNPSIWLILGALSAISIVIIGVVLFLKKRKRKDNRENDIHIDSMQDNNQEEQEKNKNKKEVM